MRKRLAVGTIVLMMFSSVRGSTQPLPGTGTCATCVNTERGQDCSEASAGDPNAGQSCNIFFEGGERWCNWVGVCSSDDFDAADLSSSGTLITSSTRVRADGSAVSACGAFKVSGALGKNPEFDPSITSSVPKHDSVDLIRL